MNKYMKQQEIIKDAKRSVKNKLGLNINGLKVMYSSQVSKYDFALRFRLAGETGTTEHRVDSAEIKHMCIYINNKLSQMDFRFTMYHEIGHVVDYMLMKNGLSKKMKIEKEDFAWTMAYHLMDEKIRDDVFNPEVVEKIKECLKKILRKIKK